MSANKEIVTQTQSQNEIVTETTTETVTTNKKNFVCIVNESDSVLIEIIDLDEVKHPILYEYLNTEKLTDNRFVNSLVMCLYLRTKLDYKIDKTASFYEHVSHVKDSDFSGIEIPEFTEMLDYCVSFSATCIYNIEDIETPDKMKIIEILCRYRNFVAF